MSKTNDANLYISKNHPRLKRLNQTGPHPCSQINLLDRNKSITFRIPSFRDHQRKPHRRNWPVTPRSTVESRGRPRILPLFHSRYNTILSRTHYPWIIPCRSLFVHRDFKILGVIPFITKRPRDIPLLAQEKTLISWGPASDWRASIHSRRSAPSSWATIV